MHLSVKKQTQEIVIIPARAGESVMELIKAAQIDELLALCGGCCSCATCHIYVDEAQLDLLPRMDEDEDALLESSLHRQPNSRLACQLAFTAALAGLRITIAPEE